MKTWLNDYKKACLLSIPLMAAMLAQRGMDLVNGVMIGRVSQEALAATVLANAVLILIFVFFIGLQSASGVLIARAHGGKDNQTIHHVLYQAIYLTLFLSPLGMFVLWLLPGLLIRIGEEPIVVKFVADYFHGMIWAVPAIALFFAFRDFVSALSHPPIIFWLSLIAIPLTIFFNYLLIFGHAGFSAMGMTGMGYGTAIVEWICTLSLIAYILFHKSLSAHLKFSTFPKFRWPIFKKILLLDWPVSINMGFEWGMFAITTLLMGYLGVQALAAHQIALQLAGMAFMLPLGISQGAAILVGQSMGAKNLFQAERFAWVSLMLGLIAAGLTAILFLTAPRFMIGWFINIHAPQNKELVEIASTYMYMMAFFQLLDAAQVILTGSLRGLKDTFVPMVLGLVSYWLIGLLSGYYFAFVLNWRGVGLWLGLGVGIGVSALILLVRFLSRIKQEKMQYPMYKH